MMFYSHNNTWKWLEEYEITNMNDYIDAKEIKNEKDKPDFVVTLTKSTKQYDEGKFYWVQRSAIVMGYDFYGSGTILVDEQIYPDKYLPIKIVFGD